jgi:hypothetical protein
MCLGCWIEEGRPFKVTEAVNQWAPKFGQANPSAALHVVIDDWNLDDGNLEFCRHEPDVKPDEIELIDALQSMTWEERWATAILAEDPGFDPEEIRE